MNNHKFLCALAVTMAVGASGCVPVCAQQRLSLQSLFDLADQQSQRIKVSEAALKAVEEGVASAKSASLPSVEFSLQGSYTGNAFMLSRGFSTSGTTEYIVPGLGPQQVQNGKQPTPHWGNSFTVQASQVVYAGGAIRSSIEMAKLGHQLAELDVEKNRQEVRFLLTGYYLDLYKLQNQSQVIARNIELTEKVIEQMKARREQGTVLQNDITRYELQLQSLQLAKTQVDDAQKIIRHQIATTIHLPKGEEEDFEVDELCYDNENYSEESWQQTAAENNIDVRQASLTTEMSEQKVKNTRAASLPSVAVVAENNLFGPYTSDLIPKNANVNVWFVGIGVKYNLSSLWKNKHDVRKAKYENAQARESVLMAREGIENAVQALRSRNTQAAVVAEQGHHLSASEAAIELARAQVEIARLNLSYCCIIATCDGVVGSKDIHAGQLVNPGQTMVSIVDKNEKWVEANYQESQMPNIKVGDKVRFTADAVPGEEYTGVVERISDATGSAFSLIPIDNATGNFVKVEQRVMVRVKIDDCDEEKRLHGGYNVVCKVEK